MVKEQEHPTKVGAGLLICCGGECLLLKRSAASGNPGTWGLPGGNADSEDGGQLLATAMREAGEEIGPLPEGLQVGGHLLTKRGKNLQKHYTVFVATLPPAARAAFTPRLNEEHTEWRWVPLGEAARAAVEQAQAAAAAGSGGAPLTGAPPGGLVVHPVVRHLFADHTEALGFMLPALA